MFNIIWVILLLAVIGTECRNPVRRKKEPLSPPPSEENHNQDAMERTGMPIDMEEGPEMFQPSQYLPPLPPPPPPPQPLLPQRYDGRNVFDRQPGRPECLQEGDMFSMKMNNDCWVCACFRHPATGALYRKCSACNKCEMDVNDEEPSRRPTHQNSHGECRCDDEACDHDRPFNPYGPTQKPKIIPIVSDQIDANRVYGPDMPVYPPRNQYNPLRELDIPEYEVEYTNKRIKPYGPQDGPYPGPQDDPNRNRYIIPSREQQINRQSSDICNIDALMLERQNRVVMESFPQQTKALRSRNTADQDYQMHQQYILPPNRYQTKTQYKYHLRQNNPTEEDYSLLTVPLQDNGYYSVTQLHFLVPICRSHMPNVPFVLPNNRCVQYICKIMYNYIYVETRTAPGCLRSGEPEEGQEMGMAERGDFQLRSADPKGEHTHANLLSVSIEKNLDEQSDYADTTAPEEKSGDAELSLDDEVDPTIDVKSVKRSSKETEA